ncbi:DgyrCDS2559 [Dimorphilus gyrociliatus]|uniref:Histone deacetylase n=1 Tax=Dimorphilus gyrociliatus TaxID=2664684 RepID=A0A7I8VFT9_9ANNE|nr:DgyrCDS2559 [Dimorphilus gyrociliatus]
MASVGGKLEVHGESSCVIITRKPNIGYVYSPDYIEKCTMPKIGNRAALTHELIKSCGLLTNATIISPRKATTNHLKLFHSSDYVEFLEATANVAEFNESFEEKAAEFDLRYDCEIFDGLFDYVTSVAGGTLTAVQALIMGVCRTVINWNGGWHHAHRGRASGYCYVNDIVIGILHLRKKFKKILYIDVDAHHGDGVQEAFEHSKNIMTVSFHNYSRGFYPGTGSVEEIGIASGTGCNVNVPLKSGINDTMFCYVFDRVLKEVSNVFSADAIVLQCGVDGLSRDPTAAFNLTDGAFVHVAKKLNDLDVPIIMLGGGGYDEINAAKCWTAVTAAVCDTELPEDIPEHEYFTEYGPSFDMGVEEGKLKNLNDENYINSVLEKISANLSKVVK